MAAWSIPSLLGMLYENSETGAVEHVANILDVYVMQQKRAGTTNKIILDYSFATE